MWCSSADTIFEATLKEPPNSEAQEKIESKHDWREVFTVPSDTDENDDLLFPKVSFDVPENEKITGFGIRGEVF